MNRERVLTWQQINDLEVAKRLRRENLTLVKRPLDTIRVFIAAACSYLVLCVRYFLSHPAFLYFLLPIVIFWGILEPLPGPYTEFINRIEFWIAYVVWWVGLGVLSSIGLGSGLQTGILFLFPHIIKVCLAAQTCHTLDFESDANIWFHSGKELFKCRPLMHSSTPATLFGMWKKVILACFLQSTGAAIGEIPPYWMTRSARLAGLEAQRNKKSSSSGSSSYSGSGGVAGSADNSISDSIAIDISKSAARNVGENSGQSRSGMEGNGSEDEDDDLPEELEGGESEWSIVSSFKNWMIHFLKKYGFYGVLLMASFPNILFDVCGVCCGHYLMPFWTFFGATFLGKAVVRNSYQSILYVTLCSDKYLKLLIHLVQYLLPDFLGLDDVIKEVIEDSKASFRSGQADHRDSNKKYSNSGGEEESASHRYLDIIMFWWQIFMTLILLSFLLSCVSQFAQHYQMVRDNEEIARLRQRTVQANASSQATVSNIERDSAKSGTRQYVNSSPVFDSTASGGGNSSGASNVVVGTGMAASDRRGSESHSLTSGAASINVSSIVGFRKKD